MSHRLPRLLSLTLAACLPAIGLLTVAIPAASAAGPTSRHPTTNTQETARALKPLRLLSVGQHDTGNAAGRHVRSITTVTTVPSSSEAGYADDNTGGHTYTAVSGNWVEPTGTCSAAATLTAFWVGIDGFSSGSVEQDGTGIECSGGTPIYFIWWEMFPANSVQVVSTALRPGDNVHASLTRNGTSYTLAVTDSTHTAASFTTTQTCASCANSSAEWIAQVSQPITFTRWNLTGASVTSGGVTGVITTFPHEAITSSNSSLVLGPLNSEGNGFTVTTRIT